MHRKTVILKDVAGSRTFSTASPDSLTSVTCVQCEPALICEEHRVPMANLTTQVFSGKCQSGCIELASEHSSLLWTSGPHTTIMDSVFHSLNRNMHISGLLKVVLQSSDSAPPVTLCTKDQIAVLLLGGCPPTAPSTSPGVLACLLVTPPCSGHCAGRHIKPSDHSAH